jgi:hypothetical protein
VDAKTDEIREGDLVRVWETREGVVVGRYGDGYYEVLVKLPQGKSLVRACREQDLALVQHPAVDE